MYIIGYGENTRRVYRILLGMAKILEEYNVYYWVWRKYQKSISYIIGYGENTRRVYRILLGMAKILEEYIV